MSGGWLAAATPSADHPEARPNNVAIARTTRKTVILKVRHELRGGRQGPLLGRISPTVGGRAGQKNSGERRAEAPAEPCPLWSWSTPVKATLCCCWPW